MSWSRSKKIRVSVAVLLGILLAITVITLKIVYKPHIALQERAVKFTGSAVEVVAKVQSNSSAWQDEVVQLTGKVTAVDETGFTLNDVAYCQKGNTLHMAKIHVDDIITIKARVIGYDDLLEEIKLDQTALIP